MKKAIKGLIVASAVAAVVGVGAVSYAAWAGGANPSASAGGQLGSISAYGFDTELTATMGSKKLMPYNQPAANLSETNIAVWSVELPKITATSATKLQVKYTTAPTLDSTSGMYVMYSANEVTTAPADTTGYQKLTATDTDLTGATFAANSQSATTGWLVVILDSSKLADMNQNFAISVTVVENATSGS